MKILAPLKSALGVKDVEKRAGLYVYRPVLNAQEWADWAAKWKVPGALGADEMHVTILYSSVDVKMPQDDCPVTIGTRGWSPGCFCMMGPDDESLVFAFDCYDLADRNWAFRSNGAVSTWPTYRPHLTISNSAGGFELPDAALAETPEFIILGGEVYADTKTAEDPSDEGADGMGDDEGAEGDDDVTVIVISIEASASAKSSLASPAVTSDLTPLDLAALRDVAKGRPVTKGVAKRLQKTGWGKPIGEALLSKTDSRGSAATGAVSPLSIPNAEPRFVNVNGVEKKVISKDVQIRMTDAQKSAAASVQLAEVMKRDDAQRLVYAISNVYSINGELVEDLDGDSFTTRAMEEFIGDVLKKQGTGKFEHEGDSCNDIVQGIVLSHELQKALGIDLGLECLVTCTHVPGDAEWAKVRDGTWEQSIAGKFWYYEDINA